MGADTYHNEIKKGISVSINSYHGLSFSFHFIPIGLEYMSICEFEQN